MKTTRHLISVVLAGLLGAGAVASTGCTNPEVPAGHEGYIYYTPLIWGKMEYRESLRGPASTGLSWRLFVENIDMREKNYPEQFELLTKDDLTVGFEVNTRIRLQAGKVKDVVENWGGANWYEWNVMEPLRTIVRREVMKVSAGDIQLETDKISLGIKAELDRLYGDSPIQILSVDMGQFEFPEQVTAAIEEKIAAQQELERQRYILAKTKKDAAIRVLEAIKVARQQSIISSTLDPLYVQREAVQTYRKLAQSANKAFVVLPNTSDGTAMPLVHQRGRTQALSATVDKMLAEKETEWMDALEKLNLSVVEPVIPGNEPLAPAGEGTQDGAEPPSEGPLAPPEPLTPPADEGSMAPPADGPMAPPAETEPANPPAQP
jgi:regulator of protease activity HflC (stomatin/prohibitin superfamily)